MNTFVLAVGVAAVFTLNVSVCAASTAELRGEVSMTGAGLNSLTIDLVNERQQRISSAIVGPDGTFQFRNIDTGTYELQILDRGALLRRELVQVQQGLPPVWIRIVSPRSDGGVRPGGSVSLSRLRHKVPEKAVQLVRRGSLEDLEKAVVVDPDYMEAHNNLGCQYLASGDYSRAIEHLTRAIALDASAALAYTNLAVAYFQTKRFQEAERSARKAIQLGDTSGKAQYVLGVVLVRLGRPREEYMPYLITAADDFGPARKLLQQLQ